MESVQEISAHEPLRKLSDLRTIADNLVAGGRTPEETNPEISQSAKQLRLALHTAYLEASGGRINDLAELIGEWRRRKQFVSSWKNVPEKLMLAVSELGEAMEAFRHLKPEYIEAVAKTAELAPEEKERLLKDVPPEQRCWHDNLEEEIADTFIRLCDLADAINMDLLEEVCWKMAKNELRPIKHAKEC